MELMQIVQLNRNNNCTTQSVLLDLVIYQVYLIRELTLR